MWTDLADIAAYLLMTKAVINRRRPSPGHSRVHPDAGPCSGKMSNIRNHDQDQHADRGHHEHRNYDKKSCIKLRQHHGPWFIGVAPEGNLDRNSGATGQVR
jgi:hypothetical protein